VIHPFSDMFDVWWNYDSMEIPGLSMTQSAAINRKTALPQGLPEENENAIIKGSCDEGRNEHAGVFCAAGRGDRRHFPAGICRNFRRYG